MDTSNGWSREGNSTAAAGTEEGTTTSDNSGTEKENDGTQSEGTEEAAKVGGGKGGRRNDALSGT